MANASGLRSPTPRSEVSSPRPKFDTELLKAYTKKLLSTTLGSAVWPEPKDRDRVKSWMKEIGDRVKDRMLEIQPKGFKYIVFTQINEQLGQGGRADMVCHWEDCDTVAQEMFANDSLICICIALAIRTY
ncbi:hypothetical protein BDP27DRAFT_1313202 [Rhodocollybia butyracea]|uniref:Topoisomerase I damage affected protein 2 n=1 Tax=Rhodocollybia butyracea TaxID=206335 RepID=A0A9P5Q7Q6_9AGAR|nr:hypothetical protein BDP27DRAFT_1313202 [Rhodocollybia butyracea]